MLKTGFPEDFLWISLLFLQEFFDLVLFKISQGDWKFSLHTSLKFSCQEYLDTGPVLN